MFFEIFSFLQNITSPFLNHCIGSPKLSGSEDHTSIDIQSETMHCSICESAVSVNTEFISFRCNTIISSFKCDSVLRPFFLFFFKSLFCKFFFCFQICDFIQFTIIVLNIFLCFFQSFFCPFNTTLNILYFTFGAYEIKPCAALFSSVLLFVKYK